MKKPHHHLTGGDIAHITDSALLSFRRSLQNADAKMKVQAASAREAARQRAAGADPVISEHLKSWHDRLKREGKLSDVNVERLELGLATLAYITSLHGPKCIPLYERLEKERAMLRNSVDTVERAKQLLQSYRPSAPPPLSLPAPTFLPLAPPLASEDKPDAGVHSTAPQP
jgi:hypothetical protein